MRQKHSRRTFLGVGIGCAAPLVLTAPLARVVARGTSAARGTPADDPLLDHLRIEAFRNYRRARAWAGQTGAIPGSHLRSVASQIGLLEGYMAGRGDDRHLEEVLRQRVASDGPEGAVWSLGDSYSALKESLSLHEGVTLPDAPDAGRGAAALEVLQRRGVRRATRVLRQWFEQEAARAETAAGRGTVIPVRQKPGDDFLGPDDYREIRLTCDDINVLIDIIWLIVAVAVVAGLGTVAEIYGIVAAAASLARSIACAAPKV